MTTKKKKIIKNDTISTVKDMLGVTPTEEILTPIKTQNIATEERVKELEELVKSLQAKKEAKTKNVTILMKPSEFKEMKKYVKQKDVSMNRFIEDAIAFYIDSIKRKEM